MKKILLFLSICILFTGVKTKKTKASILILWGDLACKACAIELHKYFSTKKNKIGSLQIAYFDKQNIFANKHTEDYLKDVIPKSDFVAIKPICLPKNVHFPMVLKISAQDTLKVFYDEMYFNRDLKSYSMLDDLFKFK